MQMKALITKLIISKWMNAIIVFFVIGIFILISNIEQNSDGYLFSNLIKVSVYIFLGFIIKKTFNTLINKSSLDDQRQVKKIQFYFFVTLVCIALFIEINIIG